MNLITCIKEYVFKMIRESEPGYKIMLMDKYTTSVVSLVLGMNEIMKQEVYMFERIDQMNRSENMNYMKCLVFVRPTSENISYLCQELQSPRYGSYYIYFSNIISKNEIKVLAEADEHEVVMEIQEIYADFLSLSPHLFSSWIPIHSTGLKWAPDALLRCSQCVSGLLFSLKVIPYIRYRGSSEMCRQLAENIRQTLMNEGMLFNGKQTYENSLLLLLDRRDDPVTPLLLQWTYEAMVHELLGIHNGRVKLDHVAGVSDDLKEVIMTPSQDEFYAKSMYLNYGEIGQTIKELMEEYQKKLSKQQKVESISDMKHFVENYPQFKKMSGTVTKHVTVVGELSKQVGVHELLEISECQQELVCGVGSSGALLQRIRKLISNTKVRLKDALNLVMLYSLVGRGNLKTELKSLVSSLKARNISESAMQSLQNMIEYGSEHKFADDSGNFNKDVSDIKRRLFKGIKGVDNVYTQHKPDIFEIISSIYKGTLRDSVYPYCGTNPRESERPQVIVVYIVGGVTHEEAAAVHQINLQSQGTKVIIGGSHIHNSESFIESVNAAMDGVPRRHAKV